MPHDGIAVQPVALIRPRCEEGLPVIPLPLDAVPAVSEPHIGQARVGRTRVGPIGVQDHGKYEEGGRGPGILDRALV